MDTRPGRRPAPIRPPVRRAPGGSARDRAVHRPEERPAASKPQPAPEAGPGPGRWAAPLPAPGRWAAPAPGPGRWAAPAPAPGRWAGPKPEPEPPAPGNPLPDHSGAVRPERERDRPAAASWTAARQPLRAAH